MSLTAEERNVMVTLEITEEQIMPYVTKTEAFVEKIRQLLTENQAD